MFKNENIMKLIYIDKIKTEVEKKTYGEQGYSSGDAECGYRDCARDILSFLNTLEAKEVREETVNEDLEEAAEEYAPDFSNSIASKAAVDAVRDAFKAGAQWQALHSLETIKGMEEQSFLAGVEAEQINKSFSKEELLNRWRNKL